MIKNNGSVIIGEGDEIVENWYFDFHYINSSLSDFINEANEFGLKVRWNKIINAALENSTVKRNFKPEKSLDIYSFIHDLDINYENWGGEMPGRSGNYLTITAQKNKINKIKKSLAILLNMLARFWKENGLTQVVLENKYLSLKNEAKDNSKKIFSLSNKLLEKEEEIKVYEKANKNNTTLINKLTSILSFLTYPSEMFLHFGPILFTKQNLIFIIANHQLFNEKADDVIDILSKLNLSVIEVNEYATGRSELPHIPFFAKSNAENMIGWTQTKTVLECKNNAEYNPNKIREDYINWSNGIMA